MDSDKDRTATLTIVSALLIIIIPSVVVGTAGAKSYRINFLIGAKSTFFIVFLILIFGSGNNDG